MTPFVFVLLVLVTYRVSMLIAVERGPARLLARLRRLPPKKSSVREGLSCPHCVGLWVAGVMAMVGGVMLGEAWWKGVLYAMAIAGASSWMVRMGRE